VIDRAELLGAVVGDFDLNVAFVGGERGVEPVALPVGEALLAGAEQVPDPVERVGLAAAVAVDVLLEAAAALVDGGGGELDDVERVEDRDRVGELVVDGVLVAVERVQRRFLDTVTEYLAAGVEPVAVGLAGPARDQVQQPGPRPSASGVRSTMPVRYFDPRPPCPVGRSLTWCQTCSSTPSRATPANRDSSSAIASSSGRTAAQTVFQVVPSCRAIPATEACSWRIWPIAHQHARLVSSARGGAT